MKKLLFIMLVTILVCTLLMGPATALAATSATITGDTVNLRSGAGTSYARICYLFRGNPVTVTGTSGTWTKVIYNGQSGYVYSQYVSPASGGATYSAVLGSGSKGNEVVALQKKLILLGYLSGATDGVFGEKTESAVRLYQTRNGLTIDGVAGNVTQNAIGAEAQRIETVIATAKKYLGLAYQWGGTSPKTGFDCSGFTQYCFKQAGITIPRISKDQAQGGVAVSKSAMRVGDIVCFNSPVSHVGIYIGNGMFIHSPQTGDVIKTSSLQSRNLTKVVRYTGK